MAKNPVEKRRATQLAQMDEVFLRCREIGHSWEEGEDYEVTFRDSRGMAIELTETFECSRCQTVRYDRIHMRSYELVGRRYDHPDGYLFDHAGFIRRSEVRREKFARKPVPDEKTNLRLIG